jgi:hypothetical protein
LPTRRRSADAGEIEGQRVAFVDGHALGRAVSSAGDQVAVDFDDVQVIDAGSSGSVIAPRPGPISTTVSSRLGSIAEMMAPMMPYRPGSSGRSVCGRRGLS